MDKKVGRNDPCPCGSGKKHKQCCLKKAKEPRKLSAKWINQPGKLEEKRMPNLLERTFGEAVSEVNVLPPTLGKEEGESEEGETEGKSA